MLYDYSPFYDPKVSGSLKTCNAIDIYIMRTPKRYFFVGNFVYHEMTAIYSSDVSSIYIFVDNNT